MNDCHNVEERHRASMAAIGAYRQQHTLGAKGYYESRRVT